MKLFLCDRLGKPPIIFCQIEQMNEKTELIFLKDINQKYDHNGIKFIFYISKSFS